MNCFCGMYDRVGVHAYGCPGESSGEWADKEIRNLYGEAERLANTMPDGSTEGALLREAMSKIELADEYVAKRLREDAE